MARTSMTPPRGPRASMSQPAGGSTAVHQVSMHSKSPRVTNADVKALKRVAAGRPDTAKGKTVS